MKRIAYCGIGLTLLLAVAGLPANAQNQPPANSQNATGDSLADYARQLRKDPSAAKRPKVFDNDNLPKDDKLSIVGNGPSQTQAPAAAKPEEPAATPAASEPKAGETKPASEAKPATEEKGAANAGTTPANEEAAKLAAWKQWGDKLAGQKDQIDLLTRELDVSQREYQVRAAAMYGDVGNRLRNSAEWDKQDAQYKQQIADKQKAVDDAKQKLEDMQEEARKAGIPSSVREP
jgi:hypothetical protein